MGLGAAGQGLLRGGVRLRAWLRGRGGGGQEVRQAQDVHQGILHRGGEERPRHHARSRDVSTSGRRRILNYFNVGVRVLNTYNIHRTLYFGMGVFVKGVDIYSRHTVISFNNFLIKYVFETSKH